MYLSLSMKKATKTIFLCYTICGVDPILIYIYVGATSNFNMKKNQYITELTNETNPYHNNTLNTLIEIMELGQNS